MQTLIPEGRIDAESVVQSLREAILILTPDLRVIWAIRTFYKTFQVEPRETEGKLVFDLGNRQWDHSSAVRVANRSTSREHRFPGV
jgi:PAS domain-containing protein